MKNIGGSTVSDPIPVLWVSLHDGIDARGPWDTRILEAMFGGSLWRHDLQFEHHLIGVGTHTYLKGGGRAIVVVPARHHVGDVAEINKILACFSSVLLILCGDEEGEFPWKEIHHDNIRFWVQMPNPRHYADMADFGFFFGNGWGAATPELIDAGWPENDSKDILWSFSGQVTNSRRKQAANGLKRARARVAGLFRPTLGFAQGAPPDEYARELAHSWVVPCPSGPESVDTFRVYEALEAGCIPLVDAATPRGPSDYWSFVYGSIPMPVVSDWENVSGVIESTLADRCLIAAQCSAWWQKQKSWMVDRLVTDLISLGFEIDHPRPPVQVVITTSPVESNPSLDIIWQTIASVERQLGEVDILIACDGVRPEQDQMRKPYERYLYYLCMWARRKRNVLPMVLGGWGHQANTTRRALDMVVAPSFLFMEHDTPLNGDGIDWVDALDVVIHGYLDVLRFHHESHILDVHEHLMVDLQTKDILGLPVRRTRQWSQRPHLANTEYYRRILRENFPLSSRTMIEDKMHSVAQWQPGHRLAIYHPEGNIERSFHLDGRGSQSKYEMEFGQ